MRSVTSFLCKPQRSFDPAALHNRALRIMSEGADHVIEQAPHGGRRIDVLRVADGNRYRARKTAGAPPQGCSVTARTGRTSIPERNRISAGGDPP
jgi:hypothetical protein